MTEIQHEELGHWAGSAAAELAEAAAHVGGRLWDARETAIKGFIEGFDKEAARLSEEVE